jgi:ribosomal protein S18
MGGRGGGRRMHRRRVCRFCIDKVDLIDFKDVRLLQNYLPERARFCRDESPVIVRRISACWRKRSSVPATSRCFRTQRTKGIGEGRWHTRKYFCAKM